MKYSIKIVFEICDSKEAFFSLKFVINGKCAHKAHSLSGNIDIGCDANYSMIRSLMFFEVVSFAFFLTSSLVAHGLKIMIKLINGVESNEEFRSHFNRNSIRKVMLCVVFNSIMGCFFFFIL